MMVANADVELAADMAREAAKLAAKVRDTSDLAARSKANLADLVTSADLAAEAYVVQRLAVERPNDSIIGEEGAARVGSSGRCWVIDPVDGTYNFANGSNYWCSAIALTQDDQPRIGAVAHHSSGTVHVGGPKIGLAVDSVPLPPLLDRPIDELSLATYAHPTFISGGAGFEAWSRAASLPTTIRMLGSGSLDFVEVATGRLGCWLQHSTPPWDWLPGAALITAVGGSALQFQAHGLIWSVAGPPTAVSQLVTAITDEP